MKLIRNLNQIKQALPELSLTIGNFDGLHLGHLEIIRQVKKIAEEKILASAILTFEPHPISFLRPDMPRDFRLGSLADKLRILKKSELDYVIVLPFNLNLSKLSAPDFIEKILVKKLNVKHLTIGYDFTFGNNREGNFKLLEQEARKLNFDLSEISAVKNNDYTCSSTLIRGLVKEGNVKEANKILGRNFTISGFVITGKKLASKIGFPTMNLKAKKDIVKPKFGVYKTTTHFPALQKKFNSITNFGIKPTFENTREPLFETHIPNFSKDVYGEKIILEFNDFIREERKFNSIKELEEQIKNDCLLLHN